jgi:hypothetical protein
VDLASYVDQSIRIKFLVHQNGFGALTGMFVDDVQLIAVRLDLPYACAWSHTRTEVTPDAETAP